MPPTDSNADEVRLLSFRVIKLFGVFNHTIPLDLEHRITAVIAPNGTGKTVCLRLINALFKRQWSLFKATNFERIEFSFSNGQFVTIDGRGDDVANKGETAAPTRTIRIRMSGTPTDPNSVGFEAGGVPSLELGDPQVTFWQPTPVEFTASVLAAIDRALPHFFTRAGSNRWVHDHTGQSYTADELFEEYAGLLPPSIFSSLDYQEPPALRTLIERVDCHLIETQRLLILPNEERAYRPDRRPTSTLAISQKANMLRDIIQATLLQYGTLAQSLDRSFPRRVIEQSNFITSSELKETLEELDAQRNRLMDAGILVADGTASLSLPASDLGAEMARLLSVYAEDNKRKLEFLSPLHQKVNLFKELIEERFIGKSLAVDPKVGFRITFNKTDVPLDKLSSGEQHQLVLFFELLFQLKSNALILIDEPELSLHVAWQRKFIPDLFRILALNVFDVLLATHSPQLIGHSDHKIVELGSVE